MKRRDLRYDWYGALIGLGLPLVGTVIEALHLYHSLSPAALWRTHLGQPLLWIMDTTPFVLGLLGRIILTQHSTLVRQSDQLFEASQALIAMELARRESYEGTAGRLFHAAQGLLGTVSDLTAINGDVADSARQVTAALSGLSQAASAAALTAETVIGIAVQTERASEGGLRQAEASGAELLRLVDEVRQFASAVDVLSGPMAELREQSSGLAELSERTERLVEAAARIAPGGAKDAELGALQAALRTHSEDVRRAASGLERLLADVQKVKEAAAGAAQAGGEHAGASARVASQTSETMRGLAISLRESARAAREIARVAQHQESDIEQVLKAMNEIAHSTAGAAVSTQRVESEARSLNDLAASLRAAVKAQDDVSPAPVPAADGPPAPRP
jgi:methyl-accepting chemotaxis protein